MFSTLVLSLVLVLPAATSEPAMVPADGLGLTSVKEVRSPVSLPLPPSIPLRTPMVPGATALVAAVGLGAILRSRRRDDEPLFVVVHGNGGSPEDFDILLEKMGIGEADVVPFDYSQIDGGQSSTISSRRVPTSDAAIALDALIRDLAVEHSNIYSIHHSKGAATGVLMISALDSGTRPPIDGYRGAALLDPPIARGILGLIQRAGQRIPFIPDNGGFHAIRCSLFGCRDVREHLGEASGVEVVTIRNPDAEFTNFTDSPDGMRVYDLVHDGDSSASTRLPNLIGFAKRVFVAHGSVLTHDAVASCIKNESERPGSCDWRGGRTPIAPMWGSGNGRNAKR